MSTYLFVPGDNNKKIIKALESNAGAVIIDLEDGVNPEQKTKARDIILEIEKEYPILLSDKKLWIRVNPENTPWHEDDLSIIKQMSSINGIMLPKCEKVETIQAVAKKLSVKEVIPLIESASGVLKTKELIESHQLVKKVAFGSVDFAYDIAAEWTLSGIERRYAMSQIVLLSRAANGEPPIDAVFPRVDEKESFKKDAFFGKQIGFFGKLVIHPKQTAWVKEIYTPTKEEIEWYKSIVSTYENANNKGAIALNGKLIDLPVYLLAKRYLENHG
ncbi:HpcH/HpaI aldolase/citrate lyase family protein [Lentibacillus jeotgali]|uniref:HpcH/HpaI aldolase/citrate lyase family protein n=1 Tax=Lentibacillus jeotgali TaxID=558169 RepID=UPI00026283F4|nr:CoA ester lyase [Lentibacillus jeotgali]